MGPLLLIGINLRIRLAEPSQTFDIGFGTSIPVESPAFLTFEGPSRVERSCQLQAESGQTCAFFLRLSGLLTQTSNFRYAERKLVAQRFVESHVAIGICLPHTHSVRFT